MNYILSNLSDEALVTAIRANMCDFFRHLSRSLPETHIENEAFTRWQTLLPHPWFNGVLSSSPFGEQDEAFIGDTIRYFRGKGVNTFTWWMEPHLHPSDWEPALSRHGFAYSDGTPGMAVDLQALNKSIQTEAGIEVRVVADDESLRTWARIFTTGYGLPADWEGIVFDLWLKLGLGFPMRNYLGLWNGEPVATSTVFFGGGTAGIYCVATLLEARGKGIGTAVTLAPLWRAREMGYQIGVLQSSDMGLGMYKHLGFRHLCQIENFYISP